MNLQIKNTYIRFIISLFLIIFLLISEISVYASPINREGTTEYELASGNDTHGRPNINAPSAIVIDVASGEILYEKDAYSRRFPASTTKIMTTLIALEKGNLSDKITMSEDAVYGIDWDSSNISLQVNEQITLEQALYAVMLASANEAAWGVAEYVAGNLKAFCDMMNERAKQIGCKDTHFTNANGLHNDDHYSTAYDLSLITREALNSEEFRKITSTLQYTIPPTNITKEERIVNQNNKLINTNYPEFYYEYCEGGKTGYTKKAGGAFVAWAKKDGKELICVTLGTNGNKENFLDTTRLFEYCFNNFSSIYPLKDYVFSKEDVELAEKKINSYYNGGENRLSLTLKSNSDLSIVSDRLPSDYTVTYIPDGVDISNKTVGYLSISIDGKQIITEPVYYDNYINSEDEEALEEAYASGILQRPSKKKSHKSLIVVFILIIVIIGLATTFYFRLKYIQMQREKKRLRRR